MFDTNDVYNNAVRGSTLHTEENGHFKKSLMGSKIVSVLLLTGIAYVGFHYYTTNITAEALVVKKELVAEIQTKSELIASVNVKPNNSEEDYLNALRAIEGELTEERENVNLNTNEQMSLSSAMSDIMEDNVLADNTNYTKELRKEIDTEIDVVVDTTSIIVDTATNSTIVEKSSQEESRTVIVKKGDTLQGISNKFYGDAMNYKRIVASNDSLKYNDTIYVGQTILLPY